MLQEGHFVSTTLHSFLIESNKVYVVLHLMRKEIVALPRAVAQKIQNWLEYNTTIGDTHLNLTGLSTDM
jgi:hypothetical protein